jgi:hypothetical protein
MINSGTHRGRPIARTLEPLLERERASPEFTTEVLDAVGAADTAAFGKFYSSSSSSSASFIVLDIDSHCVDVVVSDPSQSLARRLIGQEEPPAVRPLAGNGIGCIGGA